MAVVVSFLFYILLDVKNVNEKRGMPRCTPLFLSSVKSNLEFQSQEYAQLVLSELGV